MKISDKIRTGSDWCNSSCIIIECDDTLLFGEPQDLSGWIQGKAKGQITFNLIEAEKLQKELTLKINQYKQMVMRHEQDTTKEGGCGRNRTARSSEKSC